MKDDHTKANRSHINWQFNVNQKQVFRNWKGKQPEIKDHPAIDELQDFWADIWEKETLINLETNWYRELKDSYCTKVLPKNYTINKEVFDKVISKMANNKAPGNDLIILF